METKTTSRIINMHHLIWEFLIQVTKRWWFILLITVLGTVAGAGYAIVKNRASGGVTTGNTTTVVPAISEMEFAHVYNASIIYDKIQEQREIIDSSRWMLYNDIEKVVLSCIFSLDMDQNNEDSRFVWGCLNQFECSELYEMAAQAAGEETKPQYLKENIFYEYQDNKNFKMQITSYDEQSAYKIKDAILKYLQKYVKTQEKKLQAECTLNILSEEMMQYDDMAIADNQANLRNTLVSWQEALDMALAGMTSVERSFYDVYLTAREQEGVVPGQELTASIDKEGANLAQQQLAQTRLRTDTVLGFVLGFCLSVAMILIQYCWASKLVNGEEITRMYGLPVLGIVTKTEKKQNSLEKFLRKRQRRVFGEKDLDQIASETTTRLKLSFNAEDKIYITGTQAEDSLRTLMYAGKKQGISYVGGENILDFSPDIAEINHAAAVLLVETEGVSYYKEIDKEIQILREAGKDICGVIILA